VKINGRKAAWHRKIMAGVKQIEEAGIKGKNNENEHDEKKSISEIMRQKKA